MNIVALLEVFVKEILAAEEHFFKNPKDFYSLEVSVKSSAESFSAGFLSMILSSIDEQLCKDTWRQLRYNICRHDKRTLITSVGDVVFNSTYFKSRDGQRGFHYLLEELLGLDAHERFSEAAETAILTEAIKTSYEEAVKAIPSKSEITKTTVMNKVHGIADSIPFQIPESKKRNADICLLRLMKTTLPNSMGGGKKTTADLSAALHISMNISRKTPK